MRSIPLRLGTDEDLRVPDRALLQAAGISWLVILALALLLLLL